MSHKVHAVVEIVDKSSERIEAARQGARVISGLEAFRKYDWINNVRGVNRAGNFRGMVVSSRWATVFHLTEDTLKPVEKIAVFASLAANMYKAKGEVQAILASNDPWAIKGARLSTQVTSVASRTAFGIVPFGAQVIAKSLSGYLQLADLAGLHQAATWDKSLQSLNARGNAAFDHYTDGNTIYFLVNKYLTIK